MHRQHNPSYILRFHLPSPITHSLAYIFILIHPHHIPQLDAAGRLKLTVGTGVTQLHGIPENKKQQQQHGISCTTGSRHIEGKQE
jgi:hypothetical protein